MGKGIFKDAMKPPAQAQQLSPQGLPICPKCFWTITFPSHECDVPAGKLAKRLIAALAPFPGCRGGTMYGYGDNAVAFDFGHATIVLGIHCGRLRVDRIFLSDLTEEKAAKLVRALAGALQ